MRPTSSAPTTPTMDIRAPHRIQARSPSIGLSLSPDNYSLADVTGRARRDAMDSGAMLLQIHIDHQLILTQQLAHGTVPFFTNSPWRLVCHPSVVSDLLPNHSPASGDWHRTCCYCARTGQLIGLLRTRGARGNRLTAQCERVRRQGHGHRGVATNGGTRAILCAVGCMPGDQTSHHLNRRQESIIRDRREGKA